MRQRLIIDKHLSLQDINRKIEMGGKFIYYQCAISIGILTQTRLSPVVFVEASNRRQFYLIKYCLISLLFGWWGLPWGPVKTIQSFFVNMKGGIDFTDMIMKNLCDDDIAAGEVYLEEIDAMFEKPGKWDLHAFNRTLKKNLSREKDVKQVVVGLYLNDETPYFTIGIDADEKFDQYVVISQKLLLKQFHMNMRFEFINLSQETELSVELCKQGAVII